MSTFDEASLVFIPSGYKTSKAYSVKPSDGSGDLTFSRSNDTATRVNSAGLIEKVRTNVVLYSQDQSNAQYSTIINQITSRVASANPLTGLNNAYKITSAGGGDPYVGQEIYGLSNGKSTLSMWLWTDAGQNTSVDLIFYNAAATEVYSTSLTITTTPTRYSFTPNFTSVGASATIRLDLCQTCGVTYLYTYGWQVEQGDIATDYIATTSAAVSVGPVANVPRLDYLGSTCPRLLLEPQRTNLLQYSEQIDNAYWTKLNLTVTANQAASPDGYTNADLITLSAGSSVKQFYSTSFSALTSNYAYSGFFKKGTHNFIQLLAGPTDIVNFDLTLGTYNSPSGAGGKIENYGNGWYRCTMLASGAAASISIVNLLAVDSLTSVRGQATSSTGTFYAWGMQVEAGYATSYIPTLGASVTRGADAASKTGISSLIGQTEGTIFIELNIAQLGITGGEFFIYNGTDVIAIQFPPASPNNIRGIVYVGGGFPVLIDVPYSTTGDYKIAFAYKQNDFAMYVNGVLGGTDTSGNVPACSQFVFSPASMGGVKQALLFKTRLSNADLAALTA